MFSIQGAHFRQFAYSVGVQIIHMNGRIYDPTLGRFLQADPFIQAPNDSQSFNRYSYVLDNPMTMTDPSGYISLNPFKKITRAVIKGLSKVFGKNLVQSLGNIASLACGPAAPACSGYWNCEFARAHGVSSSGAIRGAFTAAIGTYVNASDGLSGYGTFAINSAINNIAEKMTQQLSEKRLVKHTRVLQGGSLLTVQSLILSLKHLIESLPPDSPRLKKQ
ncbi:RHS repeat domain-containing protein [Glaciecola sp. SC05]|uniref:RHS repeat domain-containing protein n=1 Tax=Glaciecola sp. SC05 TaxID=1987355 RepID=UPI0035294E83